MIDTATGTVIATPAVGEDPFAVATAQVGADVATDLEVGACANRTASLVGG